MKNQSFSQNSPMCSRKNQSAEYISQFGSRDDNLNRSSEIRGSKIKVSPSTNQPALLLLQTRVYNQSHTSILTGSFHELAAKIRAGFPVLHKPQHDHDDRQRGGRQHDRPAPDQRLHHPDRRQSPLQRQPYRHPGHRRIHDPSGHPRNQRITNNHQHHRA